MPDAASSFLNQPRRTEQQARNARAQAEQECRHRLERHGTAFCRRVLAGAFERVYQADGSYRLREIQSGAWLEDLPPADRAPGQNPTPPSAFPLASEAPPAGPLSTTDPPNSPSRDIAAARHYGYAAALRDMARWISEAAGKPHLDAETLAALIDQIAQLSSRAETATITGAGKTP